MIRLAEEKDKQWLVTVAAKNMFCEELKRPHYYNETQTKNIVDLSVKQQACLVAEKNGELVGTILGVVSPNPFNPTITMLAELMWYVLPEHRHSSAGLKLLIEFAAIGKEKADETSMSLLATSPVAISALEKRGFTMSEYVLYRKNK